MPIIKKPTPHYNTRPAGTKPDLIVLHADAGASDAGTISWIADPSSKVSYHLFVGRDGRVYRFVEDDLRAWHAGASSFAGIPDCNDYSIGVSFANNQTGELFPTVQVDAGVALVSWLCARHGIGVSRITTHAIISPGRKHDPGPNFPLTAFLARVGGVLP